MELRDALRKLRAAEMALGEARRSLDAVLSSRRPTAPAASAPEPAPVPYPVPENSPPPPRSSPPEAAPSPLPPPEQPVPVETKIIRAIAVAGSLITVIGVGLIVALAIQNGWLGPLGRVILSALLAALLLAAGLWLDRRGDSPAGVNALVVTSYLITMVLIVALVRLLNWWPEWVGALALMAAWLGFLWLSRSRGWWVVALCMGVSSITVGAYLTDSPVTWVLTLMPLTLLAATWTTMRIAVRATAAVVAVLLQLWYILLPWSDLHEFAAVLGPVSALAFAAVSLRDARSHDANMPIGVYTPVLLLFLSAPLGSGSHVLWLLLPATVALAALGHFHRDTGSPEVGDVARPLELVGLCGTAVAFLLIWWLSPPMGADERMDSTIVVAVFFLAAVAAFFWLERHNNFGPVPWMVWWGVAIVVTWNLARNVLLQTPVWLTDPIALIQAALIGVFLGFAFRLRGALGGFHPWIQVAFAVAALYLSMTSIVTAVAWLGNLLGASTGMWIGYLIGHTGVSVLWMVLAAWVLLAPGRLTDRISLWTGVLLAAAGTVKLVFFDLGALEGLPRAVAFLLSGLALLTMASLRTRRALGAKAGARAENGDESDEPASG